MPIDLNSDLGESFGSWSMGDDTAMLEVVTSANVACGFHAGDASTARQVCRAARERGVSVGAHVGYRDLAGFGRRFVDVDPRILADEIVYQIGALQAIAAVEGIRVGYVKPHGALYSAIVHHEAQAQAVVDAVRAVSPDLPIVGLAGSAVFAEADRRGIRTVAEAFADRAYTADGTLVPRSDPGAVIHDPAAVVRRAALLAAEGEIVAIDGSRRPSTAESICVHGDTPGSVGLARAVRETLEAAGITVGPFVVPAP